MTLVPVTMTSMVWFIVTSKGEALIQFLQTLTPEAMLTLPHDVELGMQDAEHRLTHEPWIIQLP